MYLYVMGDVSGGPPKNCQHPGVTLGDAIFGGSSRQDP